MYVLKITLKCSIFRKHIDGLVKYTHLLRSAEIIICKELKKITSSRNK